MAALIPVPVVAAVAAVAWFRRKRTPSLVLVGPSAGGKSTLASVIADREPQREYIATSRPSRMTISASKRLEVTSVDLPGTSTLIDYSHAVERFEPTLVCLVLSMTELCDDATSLTELEALVVNLKEMAQCRRAVVITHADELHAGAPLPVGRNRAHLVAEWFGTKHLTMVNLFDEQAAGKVREKLLRWLA